MWTVAVFGEKVSVFENNRLRVDGVSVVWLLAGYTEVRDQSEFKLGGGGGVEEKMEGPEIF